MSYVGCSHYLGQPTGGGQPAGGGNNGICAAKQSQFLLFIKKYEKILFLMKSLVTDQF